MADNIDTGAWDGGAAMSGCAKSDDPAAAYAAICAGRRDGDPALQSTWALPHHTAPGAPPNEDGVHAALSRISQTQGLINRDEAQAHLDSHMTAIRIAEEGGMMSADHDHELAAPVRRTLDIAEPVRTLDFGKRVLGLKLLTYNQVVESKYGPLMFEPGAFGDVNPSDVRLRMDHEDPPTGLGRTFKEAGNAPVMDFAVSQTQRGDDQLTLAKDGVSTGVSVGYDEIPSRVQMRTLGGRRVRVYPASSAVLAEVSTTWAPTFPQPSAGVLYALNQGERGEGQMAETTEAPVVGVDTGPIITAVRDLMADRENKIDLALSRWDQIMEQQRAQFAIPSGEPQKPKLHHWVEFALRAMRGQQVSPTVLHELALDDVITSEQPGLVPTVLTPDYDDLINQDRPFLQSTRKVEAPVTGTSMILPIITTRAVAGTQAGNAEKGDLTTTATKVGTGTFSYVSVFGGADISIQMINRAERSFFDLLTGDMGMAYALDCDTKALNALLTGYTDSASGSHTPNDGGVLDPANLLIGDAWQNSIETYKRAPDTIWMNAGAVAAFIDAKATTTNLPLYSNLAAAFTTGGGPGGTISGLRPVYVPALDGLNPAVDVIIGPSRGFVWAEDAARNLQVDVPSKAGRDIALVGGIFPGPRFADAFTTYNVAGVGS